MVLPVRGAAGGSHKPADLLERQSSPKMGHDDFSLVLRE
jgi:hypothetical protein